MYILALETTGVLCSAALRAVGGGRTVSQSTDAPMEHLKNLMPLIAELMRENGVSKEDLAAVAASVGPGSFTGIRIGVSTARALSQALGIPCLRVGTLEQFRIRAAEEPCAVVLNARRGQVYGAVYGKGGGTVLGPGPYMLEEVTEAAGRAGLDPVWYGDAIDAYSGHPRFDRFPDGARFAEKSVRYQDAELTAAAAAEAFDRKEFLRTEELLPEYMRKTEAEQKLADGSLARARARKMAKFRSR